VNKNGRHFPEFYASLLLKRLLTDVPTGYVDAIALGAIGRSTRFKAGAATLSGSLLLLLGVLVLLDVGRRALFGSEPESLVMMAVALLSLIVNATVLRMLGRYREGEVHLRATWIFTRVDVIANVAVMLSGLVVLLTGSQFPDLIVGGAIGIYVVKEAFEILSEARASRAGDGGRCQVTGRPRRDHLRPRRPRLPQFQGGPLSGKQETASPRPSTQWVDPPPKSAH
jgi:hypothetical protein